MDSQTWQQLSAEPTPVPGLFGTGPAAAGGHLTGTAPLADQVSGTRPLLQQGSSKAQLDPPAELPMPLHFPGVGPTSHGVAAISNDA